MEILFYYILSAWGLTHLLVSGKIFESARNWLQIKIPFIGELLNCYQCTSFWCSLFLYFFFDGIEKISKHIDILGYNFSLDPLIYSLIGCGIIPFISLLFNRLIVKR